MSEKTNTPLVSICVPVYNDEKFIKYAIESVINQTYQNWELNIIENCSTDGTLEVARSYKDHRINVLPNAQHLNIINNWNAALKSANGEYVKLLHSDDVLTPDCIEKEAAIFSSGKYPTVALVVCDRNIIDSNGKFIVRRRYPFRHGLIKSKSVISLNILLGTNFIGEPVTGLFKKSVFSEIGYFDDSDAHVADLDFWFRILLTGDLYVIPEALALFRISKKTTTFKLKNRHAELFKSFAKKIHNDKRYNVGAVKYYLSCFNTSVLQVIKILFLRFYLKD